MPSVSTSAAGMPIAGKALKVPAQSSSRPSDFMAPHATSAHPTSAPTMRVKEVNPAPGSKTRSRIKLLQQFTRAPTSDFTSSSLHLADSHTGAAEENALRASEERAMAAMLAEEDPTGPQALANAQFMPQSLQGADPAISSRTIQNLREQRDILEGELEMLKRSGTNTNNGSMMQANKPYIGTAVYSDPSQFAGTLPTYPHTKGEVPSPVYHYSTNAYPQVASHGYPHLSGNQQGYRPALAPLDINGGAVPGTGGLVPNAATIRKAKAAIANPTTPRTAPGFNPNVTILPPSGHVGAAVPLGMPQPPLNAPYGAFCHTRDGMANAELGGHEGTRADGRVGGLSLGPDGRYKIANPSFGGKDSAKTPAANAVRGKIHELQQDRQAALDSLQTAEERVVTLEGDNKALQGQLGDLQQRYNSERDRADQLEGQVSGAVAGHRRADELRARAEASLSSLQGRNHQLEHEVEFLQKELRQARTYMARFGGIGKDFQNATGELTGNGITATTDKEFFEAHDYYRQASEKMTSGEAGTEEEINAIVDYVLQGPSSKTEANQLIVGHKSDPSRMFMGAKDPFGAGKLGQIALLNSLKNEALELRASLDEKNCAIEGMNETIVRLSSEVARATAESRVIEQKFIDQKHHHESEKVLLADAEGEVEYLRLLTGEQTDTLNRLTDEHHKLNIQVRHEMENRSALESQRNEYSDECTRLQAERDSLLEKINVDLGTKILVLEKTVNALTKDHQSKSDLLDELQRKHDIVTARKAELEDIVERQLASLDGALQAMLSETSAVARGEEARLRDALNLLGDIRRGNAAASATEVVIHNASSNAHNAPQAHPIAALQHPYPMATASNAIPAPTAHGQVYQQAQQLLGYQDSSAGPRLQSPKRSTDQLLPYHYQQQMGHAQQGVTAAPHQLQPQLFYMDASGALQPVHSPSISNPFGSAPTNPAMHPSAPLPPNNLFLQQQIADRQAREGEKLDAARRATGGGNNMHLLGAPYASVGSLHHKDPATMEAAVSSAHAIRDAYAASRSAAQFALARYEQEASAEGARERAEALSTMMNGGPHEAVAMLEAEAAAIEANAKSRAHALEVIADDEEKKRKYKLASQERKKDEAAAAAAAAATITPSTGTKGAEAVGALQLTATASQAVSATADGHQPPGWAAFSNALDAAHRFRESTHHQLLSTSTAPSATIHSTGPSASHAGMATPTDITALPNQLSAPTSGISSALNATKRFQEGHHHVSLAVPSTTGTQQFATSISTTPSQPVTALPQPQIDGQPPSAKTHSSIDVFTSALEAARRFRESTSHGAAPAQPIPAPSSAQAPPVKATPSETTTAAAAANSGNWDALSNTFDITRRFREGMGTRHPATTSETLTSAKLADLSANRSEAALVAAAKPAVPGMSRLNAMDTTDSRVGLQVAPPATQIAVATSSAGRGTPPAMAGNVSSSAAESGKLLVSTAIPQHASQPSNLAVASAAIKPAVSASATSEVTVPSKISPATANAAPVLDLRLGQGGIANAKSNLTPLLKVAR